MKRKAEFIFCLIGGIIGIVVSFLVLIGIAVYHAQGDDLFVFILMVFSIIFLLLQIGAVILSTLVNRMNHKLFGGLMIGIGVLSFPFSFFLFYMPSALYFAAGALGFRQLDHGSADKNI